MKILDKGLTTAYEFSQTSFEIGLFETTSRAEKYQSVDSICFGRQGSFANALTNAIDIFYLTTLVVFGIESKDGC